MSKNHNAHSEEKGSVKTFNSLRTYVSVRKVLTFPVGIHLLCFFLAATFQSLGENRARVRAFDVLHIKLDVRFDEAEKSIYGKETIFLLPLTEKFSEVVLDASEMKINRIFLPNGNPLHFKLLSDNLTISLDKAYTMTDTVSLLIDYEVHHPQKGLYFIEPDEDEPKKPRQIWSQNWAEDAHFWFPCFDYPNEKSTFELLATVDDNKIVVSNGRLIEIKEDKGKGLKTYHWVQDKPIHTAIQAIAVGDFAAGRDTIDGLPVEWYVEPARAMDAPRSFSNTSKMIHFFSDKIGYPYPWPKHSNLALTDFTLYGAMENASCIFFTDAVLHDKRALLDVSSDGTVAHELSHQWWGDVVSNRDWSHLWLSEGFATYFSSLWTEYAKGEDEFRYELWNQANAYIHEDSTRFRRPIVYTRYKNADEMLNAHTYPGGSRRLHTLRFVLGDTVFWKVLNAFIRKYEYQSVDTKDFQKVIEEVTGKDFSWFFDEWLYHAGYPEFEVRTSWNPETKAVRLWVKQTQKLDSVTTLFEIPVDVEIVSQDGKHLYRIELDKAEQDFSFPSEEKPITVTFDKGNWILKRVQYKRTKDEYLYRLQNADDVIDRIDAAKGLQAEYGSGPEFVASALEKALLEDPFWGVRVEVARILGELKTEGAEEALFKAYDDRSSRVRRAVVEALGNFQDGSVSDLLARAAQSDSSYFVVASALSALGQSHSPSAFATCATALNQKSYTEIIRTSALRTLGSLKDEKVIPYLQKYASPGNPPNVRIAAIDALENFPSQNVMRYLNELEKREGKASVKEAVQRAVQVVQSRQTMSR